MNTLALTQYDRDLLHAYDDRVLARREARDAAMERYDCPECGSIDGMAAIMRESIDPDSSDYTRLYRYVAHGDACHDLYAPCWQCNPGKNPARGYEVVTLAWVRAWLARPCQCNDCRRARGEPYWRQRWSDDGHPLNERELVCRRGGGARRRKGESQQRGRNHGGASARTAESSSALMAGS